MRRERLNGVATAMLTVLSLTALLDVLLVGYTQPPLRDEGAGAHTFQLAILGLAPLGLLFLATADWDQPVRIMRRLVLPATMVVLAFASLYYLEHHFYPAHYPAFYR